MQKRITQNQLVSLGKLFDLSGKVALITGGAQGNGFAIAKCLSLAGAISIAADLQFNQLSLKEENLKADMKLRFTGLK